VNVRVESNGTINEKDKFAVRNRVKYGLESQMPDQFDTEGGLVDFYRSVALKNTHSQLIQVTCAVAEGSKIALGIHVHQQHLFSHRGKDRTYTGSSGSLANPSFVVGK